MNMAIELENLMLTARKITSMAMILETSLEAGYSGEPEHYAGAANVLHDLAYDHLKTITDMLDRESAARVWKIAK